MESKNYICGGTKFAYSKGYTGLPVDLNNIPETVSVEGETLRRKSSFHVSLICVKDILSKNPDVEQKAIDAFCSFAEKNDVSFIRYTGEFRFAQHNEKKTLVALCEISNLLELSENLGSKLGMLLPSQPTHVTLYTLQPDAGIGLNSHADMETESIPVDVPTALKESLIG